MKPEWYANKPDKFIWFIIIICIVGFSLPYWLTSEETEDYIVKQVNELGDTAYAVCSKSILGDYVQGRYDTLVEAQYVLSIYQRHAEFDSLRKLREEWRTVK